MYIQYSEIQGLKVRQAQEGRSSMYDWLFRPPSLQDIIDWQIDYFNRTQRLVGIYPELKHPDWYQSMVTWTPPLCTLYITLSISLLVTIGL